jgi:hypothetical protein
MYDKFYIYCSPEGWKFMAGFWIIDCLVHDKQLVNFVEEMSQ